MGRPECPQLPMISARISTIRRSRSMAASPARPTFTSRTLSGLASSHGVPDGHPLLLRHGDVGGVLVLHADHVVAVFDRHGAPKRRVVLVPLEDIAEVGDA